ncbi:hypothetical protein [Eubacterium aggregans]|uniref:hypothetical protein n=1 Tax=Eubacterium aggregans TaxID=81409 RepID=UPI003F2BC7F1
MAAGYKEQQENIRRAGQLRADINKGVQAGEPIYKLLLKAIECISLMTGEKLFYDANKENLQTIYGILGEPEAIEIERQEVQQRLNNLKVAYGREEAANAKCRIQNAIKVHEDKLNPFPPEAQYESITESIMNGWKGVFPKNGEKSGKGIEQNPFVDFIEDEDSPAFTQLFNQEDYTIE